MWWGGRASRSSRACRASPSFRVLLASPTLSYVMTPTDHSRAAPSGRERQRQEEEQEEAGRGRRHLPYMLLLPPMCCGSLSLLPTLICAHQEN